MFSFTRSSFFRPAYSVPALFGISMAILYFGLTPKDYNSLNSTSWIRDHPGVHFKKYGVMYTGRFIENSTPSTPSPLTLEIILNPERHETDGFEHILVIHNGHDGKQLLLAQYRSWIVLMQGDDYDHKRRTPRIAVDIKTLPKGPWFLTMVAGSNGTRLFCNGQLAREKSDLLIYLPDGERSRILLGNSPYGNRPWSGDILGLGFYRLELTHQEIQSHYHKRVRAGHYSLETDGSRPSAFYSFDEGSGERAHDQSLGRNDLTLPHEMKIFERKILDSKWQTYRPSVFIDWLLNLFGFIPFGFFLSAVLMRFRTGFSRRVVLISVFTGFLLSLTIELAQAWIPSRSSSLSDLILNTLGAFIGSTGCRLTVK